MDKVKMLNDLDLANFLIGKIEKSIRRSYDILDSPHYTDKERYRMALSYVNLAEITYIKYKTHQYRIELFGAEIEQLDKPFEDYVFQLNKAIINKEDNMSWLISRYGVLEESIKGVRTSISQMIKTNYDLQ